MLRWRACPVTRLTPGPSREILQWSVKQDFVGVIESAYRSAPDCESWLQGVADAMRPCCDFGMGVQVYVHDLQDPNRFRVRACATTGPLPLNAVAIEKLVNDMIPPEAVACFYEPASCQTVRERAPVVERKLGLRIDGSIASALQPLGLYDGLGIVAGDPNGTGCTIAITSRVPIRLSQRLRRTLSLVSTHVAAGYRLFHAPSARPADSADAVLGAGGEMLHAATAAAGAERFSLARFAKQRTVARGGIRREAPERAVELWKALVRGEWTIVDHVDSDGKRLLLAHRNRPGVGDPGELTPRERAVVTYAALGHSQKLIAYELGLSPSDVSVQLKNALKKLGLRDRAELARVLKGAAARS